MYLYEDFGIDVTTIDADYGLIRCHMCSQRRRNKENNTLFVNKRSENWICLHCGFTGALSVGKTSPGDYNFKKSYWLLNPFLDKEFLTPANDNMVSFMQKNHKINRETLDRFKVGLQYMYDKRSEEFTTGYSFPYFFNKSLVNALYVGGREDVYADYGYEVCFNYDSIDNDEVYIVINEMDVLTLSQIGINSVISLYANQQDIANGNFSCLDFFEKIEDKLKDVRKFVIVYPPQNNYLEFRDEVVHRLGRERCWLAKTSSPQRTLNDEYMLGDKKAVLDILSSAKPVPVEGIFSLEDVEDDFDRLYEHGLESGVSTGYAGIDKYYTVAPGFITVVTGIPSHGKSTWLDGVMVNIAKNHKWKFGIYSPENQPIFRHYASLAEKYAEASFDLREPGRMSFELKEEAKAFLNEYFNIILPPDNEDSTIENILAKARTLVYRKGIKGLVIDPWNEIDHSRPVWQTETEYISSCLSKIIGFARRSNVHVWIVAHPAKLYKDKNTGLYPVPTPYDIAGSAHFRNKTDNAIAVYRFVGFEDESIADIHFQKVRFKEHGRVGLYSLRFDRSRGVYRDDIDQDKRVAALEKGHHLHPAELVVDGLYR